VHALVICQDHRVCELRKHLSFLFHLFLRTFQQPNPFCCNRSTTNLFMISFLSRTINFFFFFLSLWIYLWLAETSQQPISQTTWLKVTPHCNHCNSKKVMVQNTQGAAKLRLKWTEHSRSEANLIKSARNQLRNTKG